eukprot:TRINITY_DN17090_c0_g1_i1.p1 TRINITY_DN17090_c0_g1~~TRINITY_DN17090_c0_g1_i1.p1  ORF type:complete len:356 (-),score=22.60 TRINITY_DN17090_c0_g1_i1:65-1132(-)
MSIERESQSIPAESGAGSLKSSIKEQMAEQQQQQEIKYQQKAQVGGAPSWNLLTRVKAKDLVGGRKVFSLKPETTTEEAIKLLTDNRIHSAPIVTSEEKCIGLVDFFDLLFWSDSCAPQDDRPDYTRQRHDDERVSCAYKMKNAKVSEIMNCSGKNELLVMSENDSCDNIVRRFCEGFERVVLEDQSGKITCYMTQSDIIRYLYQNLDNPVFKDFKGRTLGDLGFIMRPLDIVSENESLKDALRSLHRRGGGAVPVVDSSSGKLITSFSASDIKGIYTEDAPRFTQTIVGYLRRYNPRSAQSEPKHVSLNTSIGELMRILTLNKLHYVFCLNSENQPIGIVTVKDCLDMVVSSSQ